MQRNPNRITSNPLKLNEKCFFKVLHRTPNGRVFHCCNKHINHGIFKRKHGRYFLPSLRWDKSLRDHKL